MESVGSTFNRYEQQRRFCYVLNKARESEANYALLDSWSQLLWHCQGSNSASPDDRGDFFDSCTIREQVTVFGKKNIFDMFLSFCDKNVCSYRTA